MDVSSFGRGTLIRLDGVEHRLVRKITETCWRIEDTKTDRTLELEDAVLLRKYVDGALTFVGSTGAIEIRPVHLPISSEELELAKVRRMYVLAALNVPNTKATLMRVIAETWDKLRRPEKSPGWVTVYRWKRKYVLTGSNILALVDNNHKKGNGKARYPAEVIHACQKAISARYLSRERNTIQCTLEDALMRIGSENRLLPQGMALPKPTRRLITRLTKQIPEIEKYSARYGREAARKHFRSVMGHRVTQRALERAEIDHTILDLFVIDDKALMPLGRPYMTVCIDDYTRCILGLYIGFQPPSYLSVAKCLKDCFLPKVRLRELYPDIRCEWPAYGRMDELVLDNGVEFHSESLELMCGSRGIEIHYAPRQTPWFKGKIERFFGTLNRSFAHRVPGTTFANIVDRGDYDPAKHACVTLSELNALVRRWVADDYHQSIHRSLQTTPAAMWKASIKPEDIPMLDDPKHLDADLGKAESRMLTHKGIEFAGLFYNSPELTELRRREGATLRVDIRVDEGDLGRIFVLWPGRSDPYTVPALLPEYASGLSLWAHDVCRRKKREDGKEGHDVSGLLEAKLSIQKMIEEDLHLKRRKSRKRSGRFIEGAGRATPQAVSAHSVTVIAGGDSDGSYEGPASDSMSAHIVQLSGENGNNEDELTGDLMEFTVRIKEEFSND